jgi:putative transposase
VIVDYIDAHRSLFGVEPICRVLSAHGTQIAPSTYYATVHTQVPTSELEDAYTANALFDLHCGNRGVYGRRKLWHAARRAGLAPGRDRVARLIRMAGLTGAGRGKHSTITTRPAATAVERHPDLVKRGWSQPSQPDQWWVADFTYVWTLPGSAMSRCSPTSTRGESWAGGSRRRSRPPLVLSVLEQALFARRRTNADFTATGLVHPSDMRGCNIRLWPSQRRCARPGSPARSAPVGSALDNALMESKYVVNTTTRCSETRPGFTTASWTSSLPRAAGGEQE